MFTNDANGPDCWKCALNVEWHDCSFCPSIELRREILRRRGADLKLSPAPALLPHPLRRKNLFKPMKAKSITLRRPRKGAGFTLVELLTVIAIIGILAAMLLPVLAAASKHAKIMQARTQIADLVTDIQAYDQAYGRFPVSRAAQTQAANNASRQLNPDFTYGATYTGGQMIGTIMPSGGVLTNSEVVAILMDITNFPGTVNATVNANHQSNPQMTKFLNAKMTGWDPNIPNQGPAPGGVDNSLTYRDPWGNPYIISLDLNYDDQCEDSFYCQRKISSTGAGSGTTGYNGLSSPGFTGGAGGQNNFQFHGKVMVWSAGPDGKVDNSGSVNAVQGANKDNILSWQ